MCEGQNETCEITSDFPDCDASFSELGALDTELVNKTFYNIVRRSVPESVPKKANTKFSVYIKVGKKLGLWQNNATKIENVQVSLLFKILNESCCY